MTEIFRSQSVPVTTQSSVLSSPPPSSDNLVNGVQDPHQYHTVKDLPFELAQHVQNYYDERLFEQGLNFLTSIISNSLSPTNPTSRIILPGPAHIALAATLTVHPSFTTRTTHREKHNEANTALRLLRLIHSTAGPINAKFTDAFRFTKYSQHTDSDRDTRQSVLKTRYATSDSLFTTDDFWSIVGWALNCSTHAHNTMHYARWTAYFPLLDFITALLENDWSLHLNTNTSEESLIWQFIELASGGYGRARRIMRSIFADGSQKSLNEFHAIFRNELKPPKIESKHERKGDIDIDADEFGDYFGGSHSDSYSDDGADGTRPTKRARTSSRSRTNSRRVTPRSSVESLRSAADDSPSTTTQTTTLGPPEALRLRLHLLAFLSQVSAHPTLTQSSPTTFPDADELYTLFVEFISPLPLHLFSAIILPSTITADILSIDEATTLIERILQRKLEGDVADSDERYLTVGKWVECYTPFAAGKKGDVLEQAKVSMAVEALGRWCVKGAIMTVGIVDDAGNSTAGGTTAVDGGQQVPSSAPTDGSIQPVSKADVVDAVEKGITRRERKAREYMDRKREKKRSSKKGRKSGGQDEEDGDEDEEAWRWLLGSGERLRAMVKSL
jgi:hypothetical protein